MTLFSSKAFGGGDPLEVVERRRRSPLGLSAAVGAVSDAPAPYSPSKPLRDALRPAEAPETGSDAAPEALSDPAAANRPDDLFRARRALKEAGEPAPADPGPAGLADGLKRFQARRGLTADGFARPGGPTDRALDNIRRRRRRLAAQGRPQTGETLDDRLAVFTDAERDRRAAAADDFAALMQSRTGRLHVLRLAGTALESVARPLVERELHRLRAERSKGPPDDGSRPLSDPKPGEDPPPTQPPDDGFRPSPGDPEPEPPTQPPDDGFRPKPGEDPPPGGDDDPPPGDGDDEEPDPCAAEADAVDDAQEKVDALEEELAVLEDRRESLREDIADRRETIRNLEREVADQERRSGEIENPGLPPKSPIGRTGRPIPMSPWEAWAMALQYFVEPKTLQKGHDRSLLERYRRELAQREDELSMLTYANEDTRKRLGEAKGALRRAEERLNACRNARQSS